MANVYTYVDAKNAATVRRALNEAVSEWLPRADFTNGNRSIVARVVRDGSWIVQRWHAATLLDAAHGLTNAQAVDCITSHARGN